MTAAARLLCTFSMLLSLSACFKTELGGSVAGAAITITDLRSGAVAQDNLSSLTPAEFIANRSQEAWDKQGDLGKQLNVGNFTVNKDNFTPNRWYLVTVSGGADLDADADRRVDATPAPVAGTTSPEGSAPTPPVDRRTGRCHRPYGRRLVCSDPVSP